MKAMFYASPAQYKLLWLTHGRHHFDSISNPERYVSYISDFLAKATDGSLYTTRKQLIIDDDEIMPQNKKGGTHEK